MLIATWVQFHDAWSGNWKHSSMWAPPLWVPLATLPLGFGLLCLQYVAQILALIATDETPAGDRGASANGLVLDDLVELPHTKEFP
jgi:TRAP-type C4-dicarboxylate transport system permease small subunit